LCAALSDFFMRRLKIILLTYQMFKLGIWNDLEITYTDYDFGFKVKGQRSRLELGLVFWIPKTY